MITYVESLEWRRMPPGQKAAANLLAAWWLWYCEPTRGIAARSFLHRALAEAERARPC